MRSAGGLVRTQPEILSGQAQATEQPDASVVILCLNEADTLETCIAKAQAALRRWG
jgi:hypothetical protein